MREKERNTERKEEKDRNRNRKTEKEIERQTGKQRQTKIEGKKERQRDWNAFKLWPISSFYSYGFHIIGRAFSEGQLWVPLGYL